MNEKRGRWGTVQKPLVGCLDVDLAPWCWPYGTDDGGWIFRDPDQFEPWEILSRGEEVRKMLDQLPPPKPKRRGSKRS